VRVYLCKGRLLTGTSRKLRKKKYGPCKVLKKINDNGYAIDLAEDLVTSSTFNVTNIFEYFPPVELKINSRMISFQEGQANVGR
jgi:hypothetical protein